MDSLRQEDIATLVHRIIKSDEQAFSKLFHQTYPRLVKFAWSYTRSKTPAKDIVQESFVKLWEKRQNIDPNQSPMAYLFQIVRNGSLNYLRDRAPADISLDDLPGLVLQSNDDAPGDSSSNNEMGEKMLGWIDQLPDRQRETIQLSRFEGFDHEEIASIMDISARTVNNHIVAALKTLRKNLNDYKKNKKNGLYYDSRK